MSRKVTHGAVAACCLLTVALSAAQAENWPAWRGPRGDGTSVEPAAPLHWSQTENIAWKVKIPSWGNSTPAIWGDAIFLTSQASGNATRNAKGEVAVHHGPLLAYKLSTRDGHMLWQRELGEGEVKRGPIAAKSATDRAEQKFHHLQNMASPSPVTNGKYVVFHFGNGELAVFDFEGQLKWRKNLQKDFGPYTIWWGHANSPVIFGDSVISICMQDSLSDVPGHHSDSYLVAHDLATGQQLWKTPRTTTALGEQGDSYATPLLATLAGRLQLIIWGANQLDSYDPTTGQQLWFLPGLEGGRVVHSPTIGHAPDGTDMIFVAQGKQGPLLGVRIDKKILDGRAASGELPKEALAWKEEKTTPDSCSPIFSGGLLFTLNDAGIARCYEPASGKVEWTKRIGGDFKASPLAAGGRLYLLNLAGKTTVIAASAKYEVLAENDLDQETLASPAVAGGRLYIRTHEELFCIESKKDSAKLDAAKPAAITPAVAK